MKRFLPLLSLFLILLLLPLPVSAAEADIVERIRTVQELSPLEESLYQGMMAAEERIDIAAHGASAEQIIAAMQHLSDSAPELFHVAREYSYNTATVTPNYLFEGDTLTAAREKYLFALDMIAEGVDPQWSEAEICLYLHDYLCKSFSYDTTYTVYDAYHFLMGGRGVCQAYTLTYTALLCRFGIGTGYATGTDGQMPHIWNLVELDGEYYHVDVTWGDALTAGADYFGRATHENFLKSDAAIDAAGHTGRKNYGGIVCDSTRYDGGALSAVESPAVFLDGVVYAIQNGEVLAFPSGIDGAATSIYTVNEKWQSGLQTLVEKPAGIAAYGDTLYINTPKSICALDPASGHTEPILTLTHGLILTIYNDGDTLYYTTADDIFNTNKAIHTLTLAPALPPCTGEHSYTVYATDPASCSAAGTVFRKCTVCGHKTSEELARLPHSQETTVIPPGYGTEGYTKAVCTVCGDIAITDRTDPLPLPTAEEYRAAVAAAAAATSPSERVSAIRGALLMEPHLDSAAVADARATLQGIMAEYDAAASAANEAHASAATLLIFSDFSFFTGAGTAMLLLFLAIRRIFGL